MSIREVEKFSIGLLEGINRLLPQLSENCQPVSEDHLKKMIQSDSVHLLIAEEDNFVYGMLILIVVPIPSTIRAIIEDVVVDEKARGKGVGRMLMQAAIDKARSRNVSAVNLTSRSSRVSANHLYQNMGFKKRHTNVYKLEL